MYSQWQDYLRLVLEALVFTWALCSACKGLWQVVQKQNRTGYDASMFGLVLSLLTNVGVVAAVLFWWIHTGHLHNFSISMTYNDDNDLIWHADRVQYSSITTHGMRQAAQDMSKVCCTFRLPTFLPNDMTPHCSTSAKQTKCGLQVVGMLKNQSIYFSFQSLYIAWLIGRLTLLLACVNPRLGIVTLSLGLAAEDLGNFLLLLGGVLVIYSTMGTVVFGPQAEEFSTLGKSFVTCLRMLMGNTSPLVTLKKLTDPINTIAAVFFWSFMLLVFTLLLNFVLVRNRPLLIVALLCFLV